MFIFKEDEARAIVYALRIVREHALLTHTWPSSVGIANSPVFVYLLAPFAAVSHDPLFLSLCMNLMNLASVGVAYFLFKRIFGDKNEARLSALFYAIAPVAIHYSRKIWDPVPLPLFGVFLLYAAVRVLDRERSPWIFPLLAASSLAAQMHQSGVFFVALVLAAVLMHAPRLHRGWTAAGIGAGVAFALPYLAYLSGAGLREIAGVQRNFFGRMPDIDVVTNYILNLTGHNLFAIAGYDSVPFLNWPVPGFGAVIGIVMLLFVPVAFYGMLELAARSSIRISLRRPRIAIGEARGYNLLLICLAGQPLLYLLFRVPGVAHYFMIVFPVLFCLIPLGMSRIVRERPGGRLAGALWLLPVMWIAISVCFLSMTSFRKGGYSYGPLYGYQRDIAREVIAMRDGESRPADDAHAPRAGVRADTVSVSIHAPRSGSRLPEQWRFVFREMCACEPVDPGNAPGYRVVLAWERAAWRRGTHTIERTGAAESE